MITASTIIQTKFGPLKVCYHEIDGKNCVSFSFGDITKNTPLVRIHSACLFGEVFSSLHCDCRFQIDQTMETIVNNKSGVIVYSYKEGRGVGLENKIKSMEMERTEGLDTVEAMKKIGFEKADMRTYETEVSALDELKTSKEIISFSGNPSKIKYLEDGGYKIIKNLEIRDENLSKMAREERRIKKEKLGYIYKN